jgi:hypothetical protein
MVSDLSADISLPRAAGYPAPRRPAERLPLVYGAMQAGGSGGLWQAVCLDTAGFVYALAGHELLPQAAGNTVTLYDGDGAELDPAGYALNLAHDYAGRGVIATATFAADAKEHEPIGVRAAGKPGASGALIANPVEVAADLLASAAGLGAEELDSGAYARAWSRAQDLGLAAAGVLDRPASAASLLDRILGQFLGSWWRAADGRLRLAMDLGPGSATEGELTFAFRQEHLSQVSAQARLDELTNAAGALYAYNPLAKEYEAALEPAETADAASQGLYGAREANLELDWVREEAVARTVCSRLVGMLGQPRRYLSLADDSLAGLVLEKGDVCLVSLDWLADSTGQALVNRIMRVLSVEPRLDKGVIRYSLMDTGFHKTVAYLADGSRLAGEGLLAGGERDTSRY